MLLLVLLVVGLWFTALKALNALTLRHLFAPERRIIRIRVPHDLTEELDSVERPLIVS